MAQQTQDDDVDNDEQDESDFIYEIEFPLCVCPVDETGEVSDLTDVNGVVINEQIDGLITEQAEDIAVAVNNYHTLRVAVKAFLTQTQFGLSRTEGEAGGEIHWVSIPRTSLNDLIEVFGEEV